MKIDCGIFENFVMRAPLLLGSFNEVYCSIIFSYFMHEDFHTPAVGNSRAR